MCCGRVIDSCVTDKKKPYASCCKLSLTWTERGILQIRGTFPKTIGWHIPKNLPHTSNKRFLISIPLFPITLHARGRRGRVRMVVQFYNYLCNQ